MKRYMLVVVFAATAAILWNHWDSAPAPATSESQRKSEAAPGPAKQAGSTPALGRPASRQARTTQRDATQIAISPAALALGQATQKLSLSYDVLAKFTADDVNYLNECYRSRTNLLDRVELTRVLAVIGNEETVQLW